MKKRNILFILTDQHRLSGVGAYGPTVCRTPNLDALARQGVMFQNAYTVCPLCSPARGTIMTGQYPHTHGITSNIEDLGCTIKELQDHDRLLSRRLLKAGYLTGYTGKWHLGSNRTEIHGYPNRPVLPADVGFQGQNFPGHGSGGFRFVEYKAFLNEHGYKHELIDWHGRTCQCFKMGILNGDTESTVAHFLTNHTLDLIDTFSRQDAPFFIWHNFWGPHSPYYVPQRWYDLYDGVPIPEWENYRWPAAEMFGVHRTKLHPDAANLTWKDWEEALRHYYAFVSMIDFEIGRMINCLKEKGLFEDTTIIFCADHGETLGSHGGLMDKGFHHFEETHHIPFIIKSAGQVQAGKSMSEFVSLADFYPTVLELAQAQPPDNPIHGKSLLSLINGRKEGWRDDIVIEFNGLNSHPMTQRTLRYQNLKYGYNCGFSEELYDLSSDPHETVNLALTAQNRNFLLNCRQRLYDWMQQTQDPAQYLFRDIFKMPK